MNSPLARVILAVLGGYLLILILLSVYEWVVMEYPERPGESLESERIAHPRHHQVAINALQSYNQLPASERANVQDNLSSHLVPLKQWLTDLTQSQFQILCMGELHNEATRSFLSEEFFTNIPIDVLLLEATSGQLQGLIRRMRAGRDYFPLLKADIMNILRSARGANPAIEIYGIEETDQQAKSGHGTANSRDQSIAYNFWNTFKPGLRHLILFGALHCTNEPNWLFHNLCSQAPPALIKDMLNVRVLGEKQNGSVEAFVYFLDAIGIEKKHFVIVDTSRLPVQIYRWFPVLNRQTLTKYRSLLVFRQ